MISSGSLMQDAVPVIKHGFVLFPKRAGHAYDLLRFMLLELD